MSENWFPNDAVVDAGAFDLPEVTICRLPWWTYFLVFILTLFATSLCGLCLMCYADAIARRYFRKFSQQVANLVEKTQHLEKAVVDEKSNSATLKRQQRIFDVTSVKNGGGALMKTSVYTVDLDTDFVDYV